ncbi:Exoribonuclease II, mitochondrial [Smittium culicis]|uniref:Exoribonuclease II, mitochondrial n=2 Tax=Smittium culicis TaxID=133412 RepID=A0A1R1WXV0_9FUNG|nr:Exoribonuclease II, mitochondrial [Smittium culicis]
MYLHSITKIKKSRYIYPSNTFKNNQYLSFFTSSSKLISTAAYKKRIAFKLKPPRNGFISNLSYNIIVCKNHQLPALPHCYHSSTTNDDPFDDHEAYTKPSTSDKDANQIKFSNFRKLIDDLSSQLDNSQTPISYSDAIKNNKLLISENDNPELISKEDDEGRKLVLKRRPWKYRYPKPQRFYEPGGLTGIEWDFYESLYENGFTNSNLNSSDQHSSPCNDFNSYPPELSTQSLEYIDFKNNILDPGKLINSIINNPPAKSNQIDPENSDFWQDEDSDFAQDLKDIFERKSSLSQETEYSNKEYSNSFDNLPKNENSIRKNMSDKLNSTYSNNNFTSNRKNRFGSDLDNNKKRNYSTTPKIISPIFKKATNPKTGVIHDFKAKKMRFKVAKSNFKPKKKSEYETDSISKQKYIVNELVFNNKKIFVYDDEFYSKPKRNFYSDLMPGDLIDINPIFNKLRSDLNAYSTFAVPISRAFGRFKYIINVGAPENIGVSIQNIRFISPYYCLRKSVLKKAGITKFEYLAIKRWIDGELDGTVTTPNNEVISVEEYSKSILDKYANSITENFRSAITKVLWTNELDCNDIYEKHRIKDFNKCSPFINVDEIALKILELNPDILNSDTKKYLETINDPSKGIESNKITEKTYNDTFYLDITSWEMLRFAANELLGSNNKLFYSVQSYSKYCSYFSIRETNEIKIFDSVNELIKSNSTEFTTFLDKAKAKISISLKNNPFLLNSSLYLKDEVQKLLSLDISNLPDYRFKPFLKNELHFINIIKKHVIYSNYGYKTRENIYSLPTTSILKPLGIYKKITIDSAHSFLTLINSWPSDLDFKIYDPVLKLPTSFIDKFMYKFHSKSTQMLEKHISKTLHLKPEPLISKHSSDHGTELNQAENNSISQNEITSAMLENKKKIRPNLFYSSYMYNEFYDRDYAESIRVNFGDMPVYSIDSESTEDVDDGFSIEYPNSGNNNIHDAWLHIHVADPTRLIHPKHSLSVLAKHRMSSIYFPQKIWHMLPTPWAIDEFSLINRSDLENGFNKQIKKSITVSVKIGETGDISEYKIRPSIIKNVKRVPYNQANEVLPFDYVSGGRSEYNSILDNVVISPSPSDDITKSSRDSNNKSEEQKRFSVIDEVDRTNLNDIFKLSRKHFEFRLSKGAVTHDLTNPDVKLNFDKSKYFGLLEYNEFTFRRKNGKISTQDLAMSYPQIISGLDITSYSPAHTMVSEMMIISGRGVARFAYDYKVPIIYRVQDDPVFDDIGSSYFTLPSAIPEFSKLTVEELGEKVSAKKFFDTAMKYVNKLDGKMPLKYYDEIRYMMSSAITSVTPGIHSTLGIKDEYGYTRFSSPIRRYSDIVNHWQIKHQILVNNGIIDEKFRKFFPIQIEELESYSQLLKYYENGIRDQSKSSIKFWVNKTIERIEYAARKINVITGPNDTYEPRIFADIDSLLKNEGERGTGDLGGSNSEEISELDNALVNVGSSEGNEGPLSMKRYIDFFEKKDNVDSVDKEYLSKFKSVASSKLFEKIRFVPAKRVRHWEDKVDTDANGLVPVWRVVVENRDVTREFISVYFKDIGINAKMVPVPVNIHDLPYAGDEFDVTIREINPTSNILIVSKLQLV